MTLQKTTLHYSILVADLSKTSCELVELSVVHCDSIQSKTWFATRIKRGLRAFAYLRKVQFLFCFSANVSGVAQW